MILAFQFVLARYCSEFQITSIWRRIDPKIGRTTYILSIDVTLMLLHKLGSIGLIPSHIHAVQNDVAQCCVNTTQTYTNTIDYFLLLLLHYYEFDDKIMMLTWLSHVYSSCDCSYDAVVSHKGFLLPYCRRNTETICPDGPKFFLI